MAFGPKFILAIETSCDETAAAVLKFAPAAKNQTGWPQTKTLAAVVKSQIAIHKKFGGVVPEVAARAHVQNIRPVTEKALKDSGIALDKIDYIAVTAGPGLIPSLLVGVEFSKALALATQKPLLPVNHMLGHLYSPLGQIIEQKLKPRDVFPMISLIVSGGHTMLVLQKNLKNYRVLGQTVDDAAGEAFDKVAKLLNLPYPGGPVVSRLAEQGNAAAINFPRPMIHDKTYNFSFSGLKTAVLYYVRTKNQELSAKQDICASFQQAAVDVLTAKTLRAAKQFKARSVSISGGVSANASLRRSLADASGKLKINFFAPPLSLTGDNAEMIGLAAAIMLAGGISPVPYAKVKADSNLNL